MNKNSKSLVALSCAGIVTSFVCGLVIGRKSKQFSINDCRTDLERGSRESEVQFVKTQNSVPSDSEDLGDKWEEIKRKVKAEFDITDISYDCWIRILEYRVKDNQFYIMVPIEQGHALNYITYKYKDYFRVIINEVLHKDYEISFQLKKDDCIISQ